MEEELKVIIKAEVDKLKKGLDDAKKAMSSFNEQVSKNSKKADSAIKSMGSGIAEIATTITKAAAAGGAAVGAALVALGKNALDCYGTYEQLVGGVETLFGSSSSVIMGYAADAYKNQQMSANQYMEIVTGFSASLLQGLDGDTAAAAEYSNLAITDMADNANKMGSSMESIQNAYQGFAKQNYTMLDNLKLGYGGTKEEMERLIEDANQVKEANGEMADLSIDSFADIVEAIHIVQTEMGITGTTAEEASTTIQGSIEMAKSAWTNWVTGLMDDSADMGELTKNLIDSVKQVIENVAPRISEFFDNLIEGIHDALDEYPAAQAIFDEVVNALGTIKDVVESVISFAVSNWSTLQPILTAVAVAVGIITTAIIAYNVVSAIKAAMDAAQVVTLGGLIAAQLSLAAATLVALAPYILIVAAIAAVIAIIVLCIKHWDQIKEKVIEVANAVWEAVQSAWDWVCNLLSTVAQWIYDNVITPVINFFTGLWEGLQAIWDGICNVIDVAIQFIAGIIDAAVQILLIPWNFIWENFGSKLTEAWESFKELISNALDAISTTISNVWNTIKQVTTTVFNAIKTAISNVWNAIKSVIQSVLQAISTTVSNVWNGIKTAITTILNAIKTFITNVWNSIKTTVTTVVNTIKTTVTSVFNAVKTAISTPLEAAKNTVSNIFNSIKTTISDKINGAKNAVKSAIDKIKSFFNFTWSLPSLKLPHISISGKFSLTPPSVPKFGISWYAKGGVFDKPTLFGKNGMLGGLGEAGAEAIVPLENNTQWLNKIADKLAAKMGGNTPIIMQVDGKTFAEITVNSINALTRQSGKLALNLV